MKYVERVVHGFIIDDKEFKADEGLAQNALDSLSKIRFPIAMCISIRLFGARENGSAVTAESIDRGQHPLCQ